MLYKSNILALVGGGINPKFSPNKVIIWDELNGKIISQLRFDTNVKNIKLTKDKIIIVIEKKIYIFNLSNLEMINEPIETNQNPNGLIGISYKKFILAYPSIISQGKVEIKSFDNKENINESILCHGTNLQMISLNSEGTLLATASEKGTLIRIYSIYNKGDFIQEVRRGTENAKILSIKFEPLNRFIVCTSDKSTVHIFTLYSANQALKLINKENSEIKENDDIKVPKNQTKTWGKFLSIFGNKKKNYEYSFARVRVDDNKCISQWGSDNKIFILSLTGNYYILQFNPNEGGDYKIPNVIKLKEN